MNAMHLLTLLLPLIAGSFQASAMNTFGSQGIQYKSFLDAYPIPYSKAWLIKHWDWHGAAWKDMGDTIAVLNPEGNWIPYMIQGFALSTHKDGKKIVGKIKEIIEAGQFEKIYYRCNYYRTTEFHICFSEENPFTYKKAQITRICCLPIYHLIILDVKDSDDKDIRIEDSAATEQIMAMLQAAYAKLPKYPRIFKREPSDFSPLEEAHPN